MTDINHSTFDTAVENFLQKFSLKINIDVLEVLDNEDATNTELDLIQHKIDPSIAVRLLKIGNSFYYGRLSAGQISDFSKIITMRLGIRFSKQLITALSFFALKTNNKEIDHQLEILFAKTIALWAIAKNLATEMGFNKETVNLIEMVSLFHELGKIAILIYQAEHKDMAINEDIINSNHQYVRKKIIENLQLPVFLNKTLDRATTFSFDKDGIDLPAIIYLSSLVVDKSFREHGKLVINSYITDPDDLSEVSPGTIISDFFSAVNLSQYIEISRTANSKQ